jgi:futalosine hydrolase
MANRILVVTAVAPERDAIVGALGGGRVDRTGRYPRWLATSAAGETAVVNCGVGPASAAAGTATLLALVSYDLVICAGIGGAFAPRARVRDVVVADRIVHADLGAETPGGFLALHELGFGETEHELTPALVAAAAARSSAKVGPILTVSTTTGTDSRAALLAARHAALAEAMEGAGVYAATRPSRVPMLEIRGLSNVVGRRDLATWDLPGALAATGAAVAALLAEELPLTGEPPP